MKSILNRSLMKSSLLALIFIFVITCVLVPSYTQAKSTSWTQNVGTLESPIYVSQWLCNNGKSYCDPDHAHYNWMWIQSVAIDGVTASINRVATIKNNTTGQTGDAPAISVGDSITFVPQQDPTDTAWSVTGFYMDTPYGVWGPEGQFGACDASTYAGHSFRSGTGWAADYLGYVQMNVVPTTPALNTAGSTAGLSCSGLTCTVTSAGTINATITWPATTGSFEASYSKSGFVLPKSADYLPAGTCHRTGRMIANDTSWIGTSGGSTPDLFPRPPAPPLPPAYSLAVPAQSVTFNVGVAGGSPCWKITSKKTMLASSCSSPKSPPDGPPFPSCTASNQGSVDFRCDDDQPGYDVFIERTCGMCGGGSGTPPTVNLTISRVVGVNNFSSKIYSFIRSLFSQAEASGVVTINFGQSPELTLSTANATSCVLTGGPWTQPISGTSGSATQSGLAVGSHTFTATCYNGAAGPVSDSVTVNVVAPASATISASPSNISLGDSTTITWTTSGASSCWASGDWTGWKSNTGGSEVVTPSATGTYTLQCWNSSGSSAGPSSTTVTVGPAKTFKVCEGSCSSGIQYNSGSTITMFDTDGSRNLVACFSASSGCNDAAPTTNVTSSTTWSESGTDAVTLSGTNPKTMSPNTLSGPGAATETVTATYSGKNSSFNAAVTKFCAPYDCTQDQATVCSGDTYQKPSPTPGCGSVQTTCTGTRLCDFNWKEVAP